MPDYILYGVLCGLVWIAIRIFLEDREAARRAERRREREEDYIALHHDSRDF